MHDMNDDKISRREFITTTSVAATGLVLGACGKKDNPVAPDDTPAVSQSKEVAVRSVSSYDTNLLYNTIGQMFDDIGGISDVVKKDSKVVVKLNLTGGSSIIRKVQTDYGVSIDECMWSHPRVMLAVGKLILDAGAKELIFVDGQTDVSSYTSLYYGSVFAQLGAQYINLNVPTPYSDFVDQGVGSSYYIYKSFKFNKVLTEADAFITLPKLKPHLSAGVTGALKNHIGLVPQTLYELNGSGSRQALHGAGNSFSTRLPRVIVDLNRARPIHLAIVDAIKTAEGGEGNWVQGFNPKTANVLIVGKNPVCTDAVCTAIMGFDPAAGSYQTPFDNSDNHLILASQKGLGTYNLDEITVKGNTIAEVKTTFKAAIKTIYPNGIGPNSHISHVPYGGWFKTNQADV